MTQVPYPRSAAETRDYVRRRLIENIIMGGVASLLLASMWYLALTHLDAAYLLGLCVVSSPILVFSYGMVVWHLAKLHMIQELRESLDFVSEWHERLALEEIGRVTR